MSGKYTGFGNPTATRVIILKSYFKLLNSASYIPEETFSCEFKHGISLLGLSDKYLAEAFSVSKPVAARWKSGASAPAAGMRDLVITKLKELTLEKIQQIENSLSCSDEG